MRIPPNFFSDDSKPTTSSSEADASRFEHSALIEETLIEGTLKLPGVGLECPVMVNVRLGDILEPLKDAIRSDRAFLSDFADDDVQLSADLFDCLKAYGEIRRAA